MKNIKVKNMTSSRGNQIANQFEITTSDGVYFQSYDSTIAFKSFKSDKIILDNKTWDYSVTTGKYRNIFLNENKKATEKKIKDGIYKLANLN